MAVALAVTTLLMCGLAELRVRALLSGARVNPADIGLTLGVALSRSVSFTVALAVVVTLAWSRSDSSRPCHSGGGASTPPGHGLPQHRLRARARLLRRPRAAGDLRGVCDLAGGGLHGQGGERSEVRQRSAPAAALRVALLAIQADRARVQPTSKAPTLPGNWDLNTAPCSTWGSPVVSACCTTPTGASGLRPWSWSFCTSATAPDRRPTRVEVQPALTS
jgi:hypothetical protein